MSFVDAEACDLRIEVQVAASFEGKIVVYGDPDETPLPKKFLIEPGNRLIVRTEDGTVAVDEPLCGNCVGIFDDKVSIVLPLACAPLFREAKSIEMAVKLGDKEDCRFKLDCETLRKGLAWASERKEALAALAADQKCEPPEGCFITTACCQTLGLDDDCFELRTLRRYRDRVLALRPGGAGDIAAYYELAPQILARLPHEDPRQAPPLALCALHSPRRAGREPRPERPRLPPLSPDDRRAVRRGCAETERAREPISRLVPLTAKRWPGSPPAIRCGVP